MGSVGERTNVTNQRNRAPDRSDPRVSRAVARIQHPKAAQNGFARTVTPDCLVTSQAHRSTKRGRGSGVFAGMLTGLGESVRR
jgi:hypothetical protein